MNELALFSGAGGGLLAGKLLGWRCVCAVEIDPWCRKVLLQRQRDGILEPFPIWDDVRTFEGGPWRGAIDVISGGFPCQDISAAGAGKGLAGTRSGLWSEFARIIGEVGPRYVFVENSPLLVSRGLDRVLGDLAALGYDARWGVLGAVHAGAPHKRERIWILADASSARRQQVARGASCNEGKNEGWTAQDNYEPERDGQSDFKRPVADANSESQRRPAIAWNKCDQWQSEPDVGRVANGVANRMDRLRVLGNGQVPAVAALAWNLLRSGKIRVAPRRLTRRRLLEELDKL